MRFLIDRCAGRLIADWLRDEGHDVVESRERGPRATICYLNGLYRKLEFSSLSILILGSSFSWSVVHTPA